MVQRLYVYAEYFWPAISQCKSPVRLAKDRGLDLRSLPEAQKEAVLPSAGNEAVTLDLQFADRQDYIRFVLAYLITQKAQA